MANMKAKIEYAVYDSEDKGLPVIVGRIDEIAAYLGVTENQIKNRKKRYRFENRYSIRELKV